MPSQPVNVRTTTPLDVLILAAGLGTRMKSGLVKVLHKLDGRPLIAHVCRTAAKLQPRKIYVVVGHQAEQVEAAVEEELGKDGAAFVIQEKQRGTGDAVLAAGSALKNAASTVLILSGDVPLVRAETLNGLIETHAHSNSACTILTVRMENPMGYGRVVRDDANIFRKIVEQKDANDDERQIREVNSGIYCFDSEKLFSALEQVRPSNNQSEYYLTDVPAILNRDGQRVGLFQHLDVREVSGITLAQN